MDMARYPNRNRENRPLAESSFNRTLSKPRLFRAAENYAYKVLKSETSIRLLELQPGDEDDPIDCKVSIFEQNQTPRYNALSYAWGDPQETEPIRCNGKKLNISVNLRDAMQHIREISTTKYLWVDAICINQNDEQELGHQVAIMDSIYAGAERVLVWLGANNFDDEADSFAVLFDKYMFGPNDSHGPEFFSMANISNFDDDTRYFWECCGTLTRHPYFRRLWVLQEVGLGKSIVALLGITELDFNLLLKFFSFVDMYPALTTAFQIKRNIGSVFATYPSTAESVFGKCGWLGSGKAMDFLDILLLTANQMAKRPRDYIFALLGHPSALINGRYIVEPNYKKDDTEIFHEVAVQLLKLTQNLRVLSAVHHIVADDLENGIPSWVPTWRRENSTCRLGVARTPFANCNVSANLPAAWSFGDSERMLHIHGFCFDVVDEITRVVEELDAMEFTDAPKNIVKVWPVYEAMRFRSRSTLTQEETLSEICHLMAAKSIVGFNTSGDFSEKFNRLKLYVLNQTIYYSTVKLGTNEQNPDTNIESLGELQGQALDVISSRRLFSTKKGLIGLSSPVIQEGDQCCILFGHPVPFILRPIGSSFKLVGEAYVHGVMQGEAVQDFILGKKYSDQIFDII